MYAVTQKFKDYAAHPRRKVHSVVEVAEATYTDANIIEWHFEDAIITDNDLRLGAVVSSVLNLTLNTEATIPSNAQIIPKIRFSVDGDYTEWLQMGVFYVDGRSYRHKRWRFNCFDRLLITQQNFKSDLLYPNTMYQVIVEMSANLALNVSAATLNMLQTLGYTINAKPNEEWSYRDVLSYIATACGCNVRMNRLGEMEFVKFGTGVVRAIGTDMSSKPENVAPVKTITQLVCNLTTDQEPIIIGIGDVENALHVTSPYITEASANAIFAEINNLSYTPIQVDWRCEAYLDVGDRVTIASRAATYETIILRQSVKYRGGLSAKIESPSSTVQQSEFQFGGALNNQIAEVGKRIGLFAHSTNTAKKTVKQTAVQVALMPLTTASETDIEFVVTCNGVASVASTLHVSFRILGSDIGRTLRVPVVAGANFISFSTLAKRLPKVSDWLFCRMVIDTGQFVIEKEELEFYIYGGNIVSGTVRPILDFEDIVSPIGDVLFAPFTDSITIHKMVPVGGTVSDIVTPIEDNVLSMFSDSLISLTKTP